MELRDEDFEVATGCNAQHPDRRGGQHVAKPCTGVRITHKPTGISVLSDEWRSQHANRVAAFTEIKAKILLRHIAFDLATMTDEERMAFFAAVREGYCDGCGREFTQSDDVCHCRNDD